MIYQQVRASQPPPLFELQLKRSIAHLVAEKSVALPTPRMRARLHDYIESMLLAENMPPTPYYVTKFFEGFSKLLELSESGRPLLYRKRDTLSLIFNIFAVQSEMRIDCPDELVLGYTQSMMGFLLFKSDTKSIGMIGLGGGSLAKFCYRNLPEASIDVAEIDEKIIGLRKHFCIPDDDERLKVHCMDGADFVRQAENQFDVLMIDGFNSNGQPPQLCSQLFYDDCYRSLKPDGIMVTNLLSGTEELKLYSERIRLAFHDAFIVIDAMDSSNKIAFARKGNALQFSNETLSGQVNQMEFLHPLILGLTAQSMGYQLRDEVDYPSLLTHEEPFE